MSLINDALKRSESDRQRNASPYFNNLTVMMPEGDDVPPPPRPVYREPKPPRRPTRLPLLLLMTGLLGLVAWFFYSRSTGQVGPEDAAAGGLDQPTRPMTPAEMKAAANRKPPSTTLDKNNTDGRADNPQSGSSDGSAGKIRISGGTAESAFTEAMRKLAEAEEAQDARGADDANSAVPAPIATRSDPLRSGSKRIKFKPAGESGGRYFDDDVPPAPPQPKANEDQAQPKEPAQPSAPAKTDSANGSSDGAPAEPTKPAEKPVPSKKDGFDTSKLHVTAILRGSQGNVVLINGGLYRVGQRIQGARIARIGQYEVELSVNDKMYTIRIK